MLFFRHASIEEPITQNLLHVNKYSTYGYLLGHSIWKLRKTTRKLWILIKQQMRPQSLAAISWDALGDALETCQALLTFIFWVLMTPGSLTVHWTLFCLFCVFGFLHQTSRDAQGPPCSPAALQLLSDFISCISVLLWANTELHK